MMLEVGCCVTIIGEMMRWRWDDLLASREPLKVDSSCLPKCIFNKTTSAT